MIQLKRAYAPAEPDDGYRILVDRLWPRGMSKAKEHLDLWMKQIAPSTDLRKAWNHNPNTILEFAESYRQVVMTPIPQWSSSNRSLPTIRWSLSCMARVTRS